MIEKDKRKEPDGNLYKKETTAVLAVAGLLCLSVFCLCGFFLVQDNPILFSQGRERNSPFACVSCEHLIKHTSARTVGVTDPLIDILGTILEDGEDGKCCAYNSIQMSALLELSMRRQPEQTEPLPAFDPNNFTLSMASAHKKLYPPHKSTKSEGPPTYPTFENCLITTKLKTEIVPNGAVIEHMRRVKVSDEVDGLEIIHPGMYQVYTMVDFSPDSVYRCKDFDHQTFEFHIVRKGQANDQKVDLCPNDESHTVLLSASHTCCDECSRDDETKYSGRMVRLEKGDVIQMKTTAHDLVFFKKQVTFLGLFMLGTGDDGYS